jgi:hypothetical protein
LSNNPLSNKSSSSIDNKQESVSNFIERDNKDRYQSFENQFNDDDIKDAIATITGSKLDMDNNTKLSKYKNIDDPIIEEMQRQSQA